MMLPFSISEALKSFTKILNGEKVIEVKKDQGLDRTYISVVDSPR